MNIYSIDNLEILNNLVLTNLELIKNNNSYKSNLYIKNKEILIEFPKCEIKSGLHINTKIMDLVYDSSLNLLNEWIKYLEEILCNKIYEKNNIWFTNHISKNIIKNMITPLYRKYNKNILIRTYNIVDKNVHINNLQEHLEKNEIIPIIKLDSLIINSNSFDIKLIMVKSNTIKKENLIEEVNLVINESEPIKLKKHNEVYIKYYRDTILKANSLKIEAINKYLEAKQIKSKIDTLTDDLNIDENNEIENLNNKIKNII